MSKREKLRRRLRDRPANAAMHEVRSVLEQFGFTLARTRGSHHIFEYEEGEIFAQILVPMHGRRVKKAYVRNVVELLDEMFPQEAEGDDDEQVN